MDSVDPKCSANFSINDIIENTQERRKICSALSMDVHDRNLDFVDYKLEKSLESPNKFYIRSISTGKCVYYCDYEDATKSHRLYEAHQILIDRERLEMMEDLLMQYGYKISDTTSIDYDGGNGKFYLFDPECNGMVKWASIKFTKSTNLIDQDDVCWVTHNASNSGPGMYAHTFFKHAVFMDAYRCIRYIFVGLILRSPLFVAGHHQRNQENIIVTHIETPRMYVITRSSSQGNKTYAYHEYRGTLSSRVDDPAEPRVTETQDVKPVEFAKFPHRDEIMKTAMKKFEDYVADEIAKSITAEKYDVIIPPNRHHSNPIFIDRIRQICKANKYTLKDVVLGHSITFSVI